MAKEERQIGQERIRDNQLTQQLNGTMSGALRQSSSQAEVGVISGAFEEDLHAFDVRPSLHVEQPRASDKFCPNPGSKRFQDPLNFDAASKSKYSFLNVIHACLQLHLKSHIGFRDFVLLSCEAVSRTVQPGVCRSRGLFPCPPPVWRWTGSQHPSPKRRRRRKFFKLLNAVVQQIVCCLNWQALGHVKCPPPSACVGFGYTHEQLAMIERIESHVVHFLKAGVFDSADLGRCADKFDRVLHACQELPDDCQDVDLLFFVNELNNSFDPYGSKPRARGAVLTKCHPFACETSRESGNDVSPEFIDLDASTAKPVVADRIKWAHSPQFDPRPFLTDPVVARASADPEALRLPEERWIKKPIGKVHCSRQEVLKLASKWDSKGCIFNCSDCNHDDEPCCHQW